MGLVNFISQHKLLCIVSLGFAVIGYMGYRTVEWMLEKTGLIEKTNDIALTAISTTQPRPKPILPKEDPIKEVTIIEKKPRLPIKKTNDIALTAISPSSPKPISPQKAPAKEVTIIEKNSTKKPPKVTKKPKLPKDIELQIPILGTPISTEELIKQDYSKDTELARKYSSRLRSIANTFNINSFIPARGDGNCFLNAAVAGLLQYIQNHPEKKSGVIDVLKNFQNHTEPYIRPDPTPDTENYLTVFNKTDDFNLILDRLEKFSPSELFFNNEFASTFARVLRYILFCKSDGSNDITLENGDYIELLVITFLNKTFGTNGKVIILEGRANTDLPKAASFYRLQGNNLESNSDRQFIDSSRKNLSKKEKTADFLLIFTTNHYFCAIPN